MAMVAVAAAAAHLAELGDDQRLSIFRQFDDRVVVVVVVVRVVLALALRLPAQPPLLRRRRLGVVLRGLDRDVDGAAVG